ncbi:hypothetical protein E0485_19150 [Paenibacillus albiflavus]|uniref:Uncharacterized protein n=1 Tax=Paenibacillus albiflavus TaxID=2545760 RepID=A0A4R4E9Z9_9BACL|nr:hypothetical protein [Paenibacillus albiflavus]TCZ74688.1 hypothetical protein E0485_19150 [Paenibacillus albiflavus]
MNEKDLIHSISKIGPTDEQQSKMLSAIINRSSRQQSTLKRRLRFAIPALCIICAVFALLVIIPRFTLEPVISQIEAQPMSASTSNFMRKYFNYSGNRYEFINNGAQFDFSQVPLTEELGTLNHEILLDRKAGKMLKVDEDLSTTFAVGGTLYQIPAYNSAFRIAVVYQDNYYMAQFVGHSDNSPVSASEYFTNTGLSESAKQIELLNFSGTESKGIIGRHKTVQGLIEELAQSVFASDLKEEDYMAIGKAQSSGNSFLLRIHLADKTSVEINIIPELGIVSIGDNRYYLTKQFISDFTELFDGFEVTVPAYEPQQTNPNIP